MTFKSVPCQMGSHKDCDGLVHWVPLTRQGRWQGNLVEGKREKDLQPHICPCKCHRVKSPLVRPASAAQGKGVVRPLHAAVTGEGDS